MKKGAGLFEDARTAYSTPSSRRFCVTRVARPTSIWRALAMSAAGVHGRLRRYFWIALRARCSVQAPALRDAGTSVLVRVVWADGSSTAGSRSAWPPPHSESFAATPSSHVMSFEISDSADDARAATAGNTGRSAIPRMGTGSDAISAGGSTPSLSAGSVGPGPGARIILRAGGLTIVRWPRYPRRMTNDSRNQNLSGRAIDATLSGSGTTRRPMRRNTRATPATMANRRRLLPALDGTRSPVIAQGMVLKDDTGCLRLSNEILGFRNGRSASVTARGTSRRAP